MNQQLHVVQSKLLDVLPQVTLLIHALDEREGGGANLQHKQTKLFNPSVLHQRPQEEHGGKPNLLFLVRAEVQENMKVLELSGRAFEDELLQGGHAQVNTGLTSKQRQ